MFGESPHFPWIRVIAAAFSVSLVEAFTTQVDNLMLPLVMFIAL